MQSSKSEFIPQRWGWIEVPRCAPGVRNAGFVSCVVERADARVCVDGSGISEGIAEANGLPACSQRRKVNLHQPETVSAWFLSSSSRYSLFSL